ncbi:unnamed protein product [Larinioides sclopetarius]|uniref:LRP2-binding protein n=1 Tax=Larinioides sclopetarius TaxID=280406 RepID=A0AAV2B270_9ARAC
MMFLAYMYFEGVGCVEDMPRGVSYLQKLVNTDDIRPGEEGVLAIALFYMGELYYRGIVVPKDNELAEKLAAVQDCKPLAKAEGCPVEHVKRGVSMGCFYLALCCQYGYGTFQDKSFAEILIRKAIELSPDVAYDLHAKAILGTA